MWLCMDSAGQKFAVKQFPKQQRNETNYQSGLTEVKLNSLFYDPRTGQAHPKFQGHPGLMSICRMYGMQEDKNDLWLIFELCGRPLSKILLQTKGQFFKGERIYEVQQDVSVMRILERNNAQQFKKIVMRLLQGLSLLHVAGLVHCDLKSENVLVSFDPERGIVSSVKIIDFGTSFNF